MPSLIDIRDDGIAIDSGAVLMILIILDERKHLAVVLLQWVLPAQEFILVKQALNVTEIDVMISALL
jgi:hypothetical protein